MSGSGPGGRTGVYERDSVEFARFLNFTDAVMAFALTLLAATVSVPAAAWSSFTALRAALGWQFLAFLLSFAIVALFWRSHHRFVARLVRIDGALVTWNFAYLAAIMLLPFTTEALGGESSDDPLAVAAYAAVAAFASCMSMLGLWLAARHGLLPDPPGSRELTRNLIVLCDTPIVFLLSIPVAYLVSADAARYLWLLLVVSGPITARFDTVRRERTGAAPAASAEEGP